MFVERGIAEVLLLSVGGGVLGVWIVARGLAFYSHAVAAAAFPGLVLAAGIGFAPLAGALGTGFAFALGVGRLSGRRGYDALTALALVACLALGVTLASDVFHSGSDVDTLLFGSLLAIRSSDLTFAALVAVLAVATTVVAGPRWLARGFDPAARSGAGFDLALLGLVALAAVAALAAVGSLLATSLLVVPAVTARVLCSRVVVWQLASVALAAAEGVGGIWVSLRTNAPPGAAIATLGGGVFLAVVVGNEICSRYAGGHDRSSPSARAARHGARRRVRR
jgi:ABC-type Mn2+/Zn2+ transport system permease subunit